MTTIQTSPTPARFRRISGVVTAAGALIAVGIAALFLTLAGPTHTNHSAIQDSAPAEYHGTYYPLVQHSAATQYHGTDYSLIQARASDAPRVTATGARPTTRTLVNPRKSYGAVP
jgi:hypothetical protein